MTAFLDKVEDIVNTGLDTLKNHILDNTSARKKYMDLTQFRQHVHHWAVSVWRERQPVQVKKPFQLPVDPFGDDDDQDQDQD